MNPETAKKLAQMGDVKGNAQKLKMAIEKAKANPDHPDSVELRRRLERGMFNVELQSLGKKPFPVQQPKIDLGAAMAAAKPAMAEGASVQSKVPTAPQKTGIMETAQDVGQTFMGVGGALRKGAEKAGEIMRDEDFNLVQKGFGVLGAGAGAVGGAIGEATVGAGKAVLSQEQEDFISGIAQSVGKTISETEAARKVADWYDTLDKDNKLIVDSAGGMFALMAEAIGLKGAGKVGTLAREGVEAVVDVTRTNAPAVARQVDDLFRPTEAKLTQKIDTLFTKAVRPTMQGKQNVGQMERAREQAIDAVRTINLNVPNLKFTNELGEVVEGRAPESLREFSQSIEQTKASIYKQYNDLAKQTGDAGVKVNPVEFTDEFDAFINNKSVQVASPETVEYAKMMRDRYGNAGELSPEDIENIIKIYNQDLQTFYKNPTADQGRKVAVDAMIVNNLRKQLDTAIEKTTGEDYQKLKNQYGALRSIEKDVLNATLRDARKNTAGLIDYTDILTGGDLVTGVLSMNPAVIGGAVAQRGVKSYFKYLNDPNTNVKKMFQTAETLQSRPKQGYFERVVTGQEELSPGLSIRSTVTPAKVGAQLTEREFDMLVEGLDDIRLARTQPDFNELLAKYGLKNADDEELVRFIREATDEFETPGATEKPVKQSFNQGATPATTDLVQEARKYKSAEEFVRAKTEPSDYGYSHRPTEGPRAFDLTEKVDGEQMIPSDMYSQWYGSRGTPEDIESINALKKIKGNPEAEVTIYRASPSADFNYGDWVTLSKRYAKQHAESNGDNTFKVNELKVKAKDIRWAMDDVNEFGYYPENYKSQLEDIWKQANKK